MVDVEEIVPINRIRSREREVPRPADRLRERCVYEVRPEVGELFAYPDDRHLLVDSCRARPRRTEPDRRSPQETRRMRRQARQIRQALEAGTDPAIVGEWIEEVKRTRKAAEVALRPRGDRARLSTDEIKKLVTQLKGIVEILKHADPEDRRAAYQELNPAVVYHDDGRMQVTAGPDACTNEVSEGRLGL